MNVCLIAGCIRQNGTVKGTERKVLRFSVETRDGNDEGETRERINHVPCVVFGVSPQLAQALTNVGEGLRVEFQGRVVSWNGDNGGRTATEVVVFNRSLTLTKD